MNIFYKILKIKNQNNFKNCNLIITIKNHNEIMNILKRYFENNISNEKIILVFQRKKTIFNDDNNHVCLN